MLDITYSAMAILFGCLFIQAGRIKKYKNLNIQKDSFLANISHDLKSPARAQINMLNLLMQGEFGKLNPKQYEMVKLTFGSSKYMSNLVGNIMTSYKDNTYKLTLNKTQFDLIELINNVCQANKYLLEDKNQRIVFTHPQITYIYADKLQFERVIFNLLSNAITYGNRNSEIKIEVITTKNKLKFSISNNGKPISDKELKNLFKPFSQTKSSIFNNASTGLGLHITRRIIERHHGKIYAYKTTDGACVFEFTINTDKTAFQIAAK